MAITGILLFDDAEELDFVGPWEVFTMARIFGHEDDRVITIAEREGIVRAHKGMRVIPDHTLANAPPLDVLLVPGGLGTQMQADNSALIDWIRHTAEQCTWVTSVFPAAPSRACQRAACDHPLGLLRGATPAG